MEVEIYLERIMQMQFDIFTIASLITAVTTIIVGFLKVHGFLRKLEERFENIDETLKENTIHILKMAVLDTDMPLVDRIHAGERYLAMGGNGTVKKVYEKLLDDYAKQQEEYRNGLR